MNCVQKIDNTQKFSHEMWINDNKNHDRGEIL